MEPTLISAKFNFFIEVLMPDGSKKVFPITKSSLSVGRAPDNDIVIDDPSVSRQHATFHVKAGGLVVTDLGSSNGTFIGDQRLPAKAPKKVNAGDHFRLGDVRISIPKPPEKQEPQKRSGKKLFRPLSGVVIAGLLLAIASMIVITGAVAIYITGRIRLSEQLNASACQQPPMVLLMSGGQVIQPQLAPGEPVPTQPAGRPIVSMAFLDLPFPYDGGNENFGGTLDQFLLANQRNAGQGGRINSFFDHYLPLYPASKDPDIPGGQEPAESPIGDNVLLFDGSLSEFDAYSGHPGYDYSTYEYRTPSTPLFAAADGVIYAVGEHSASGALFVKIVHNVPGVGDFLTVYWHLHPDRYFEAMLGREGEPITAGTRIGTMGNTGFSTGHHLHFEVRFDVNQDGQFPLSEVIDPFGYIPSPLYPSDPWFERTYFPSSYLWIHPLGVIAEVPESGGGSIDQPNDTGGAMGAEAVTPDRNVLCAQPGSLPPGGQVYWSLGPGPRPTYDLASASTGCVLSVLDAQGVPVERLGDPLIVSIPYDEENVQNIDPDTLQIYWQEYGSDTWKPLETHLDPENNTASAITDRTGRCALLGYPTTDIVPPETRIEVAGATAADGAWYQAITVTLESTDPSGVQKVEYSLDGGTTWDLYTGPFTIEPAGVPKPITMNEEFFGGLPGNFLILATATDSLGNIENPPVFKQISINPTKDPLIAFNPDGALAADPTPIIKHSRMETTTVNITQTLIVTPTLPDSSDAGLEDNTIRVGPDDFPEGTDPLTGLPCDDQSTLTYSPGLVSVTNFPVTARPQAGISYSPYVFEMYIGEGMTRFLALFHCDFPKEVDPSNPEDSVVGPIRSGRLPYESIRKLYSGFLVMASADPRVGALLGTSATIFGSDENDVNSALIDVSQLRSIAEVNSDAAAPPNLTGNLFDSMPPPGGKPASTLWVFYNYLNQIQWMFDPTGGYYLRYQDNADGSGEFYPSTDRLNGEQLAFENVIVLYGEHSVLNSERTMIDINLLYNTNTAYIFRDGQMFPVLWTTVGGDYERTTGRMRPIRFTDYQGNPFPLKPGSTWVEMVDLTTTLQEIAAGYWKVRFYAP
ncbi:MAG: DUF3048 domain-containing protein [Chloroflexota bacterium]|nr:MAG: DUF3048 domain-containing protein [Chloroflexota bacterium]